MLIQIKDEVKPKLLEIKVMVWKKEQKFLKTYNDIIEYLIERRMEEWKLQEKKSK